MINCQWKPKAIVRHGCEGRDSKKGELWAQERNQEFTFFSF